MAKPKQPEYEVVWDGRGSLTPDCPQELYQLQDPARRDLVTLGLVRFGDNDELERDASFDWEARYLVPAWKKRQRTQRADAKGALARSEPYRDRPVRTNGKARHAARLSDETVRRIRRAYANGEGGFKVLGKRFGISSASVSQIIHRDTYRTVKD